MHMPEFDEAIKAGRLKPDGKIMKGEKDPDYGPVIDICTAASLRELATPAIIAVLAPVIIGFGLGPIVRFCVNPCDFD